MTIESNVPLPAPVRAGRPPKYRFSDMHVGDSFKVKAIYQTIYTAAKRFVAKSGNELKRFEIRKEGSQYVRVWRVADYKPEEN
jgi:hypothetical protein